MLIRVSIHIPGLPKPRSEKMNYYPIDHDIRFLVICLTLYLKTLFRIDSITSRRAHTVYVDSIHNEAINAILTLVITGNVTKYDKSLERFYSLPDWIAISLNAPLCYNFAE